MDADTVLDLGSLPLEQRRVHKPSSMGVTQAVCKEFRHVDETSCSAVFDKASRKLITVQDDEDECQRYIRRKRLQKDAVDVVENVYHHFTADAAMFSEFENEALINLFLTKLLVDSGLTPHITMAFEALRHKNSGFLLMERLSCTLDDVLNEEYIERRVRKGMENPLFAVTDVCGLFFQAFFALVIAQRKCKLKHHDLHSGNIFLKRIDDATEFRGTKLHDVQFFHYHMNGIDFYIPNCGFLSKIGDFGMSSLTVHGRRLQRIDMDLFNDDPEKWGNWNANYEGERGYDAQVLFADVPVDGRHRSNSELHHFLKHVRVSTNGKKGRITKKKFRPLPGHVSNLPADSILQSIFVRNVRAAYNFMVAPPATARTVTLGDTRWLE
jgi:serine/threonine protein kinase